MLQVVYTYILVQTQTYGLLLLALAPSRIGTGLSARRVAEPSVSTRNHEARGMGEKELQRPHHQRENAWNHRLRLRGSGGTRGTILV